MPDGIAQITPDEQLSELAQLANAAAHYKEAGNLEATSQICSRIIGLTGTPVTLQERTARGESFNFLAAQAAYKEQYGTAMDFFHQAISLALSPNDQVQYRMNLIRVLLQIQWRDRARQEIDRCLKIADADLLPRVYGLSGLVAREEGDGTRALADYRKAAELCPDAESKLELAAILADTAALDDAQELYQWTIDEGPEHYRAQGYHGVGLCQMRKMEIRPAIQNFDAALALDPSMVMARWNRALSYLTIGNYVDGWREHEYRFQLGSMMGGVSMPARRFNRPMWDGRSADEGGRKRIHIHSEMGLGDTLQFCRYAPLIRDMGHDVRIETAHELVPLLTESFPGIFVREQAADWPGAHGLDEFDVHAPMMSLPFMCKTTMDTIPWDGPYLKASERKIGQWADRVNDLLGKRAGICWHGRARDALWVRELDRRRSIDLRIIADTLSDIPRISFVSLDLGKTDAWPGLVQYGPDIHDFGDTAAIIANLDLVISVDTSVCHLAAGLGKPTWLLNRYDSCWRWLKEGDTTLWYPSMRIYRQPALGDWQSVLDQVSADLRKFA